jgi:serine protease Do
MNIGGISMDEYKNYNDNMEPNSNDIMLSSNAHNSNSNEIKDNELTQTHVQNQCFTEKIKNQERSKNKKFSFRKIVAFALVAVMLGGFFQLGMEFSKPLINNYINPMIGNNVNESNRFSFNDHNKDNLSNTNSDNLEEVVNSKYTSTSKYYVSPVVEIAENVKPSIVTITSTVQSKDWFNNQFDKEGTGSGIIFGEDEDVIFIVTNYHVIQNAKSVDITFFNSENMHANVVGYEKEYDLAVLSVSKKDMKNDLMNKIRIAKLGDSNQIDVGELAVAIGNPLGKQYSNTVTVGYISAINRTFESTDKSISLIQTDAAINPGNSGGALVNAKSEVIGINSYKLEATSVEGMGFAIPVNDAKPIIEDIVNKIDRPVLGITGRDITDEMSDFYDVPIGILVYEVVEGSGADMAGIEPQDIIFEFGNVKIFNFAELSQEIEKYKVGDVVSVKVARKSGNRFKKVELKVRLTDSKSIMMP